MTGPTMTPCGPWRIWYADGSTVSSEEWDPVIVPARGVQVIAQPDSREGADVWNVRWLTLCANWYYWHAEASEWMTAECLDDVVDLLLAREPVTGICKGRRLPHARFQEIYKQAQAWAEAQDFGTKTHFAPEERQP